MSQFKRIILLNTPSKQQIKDFGLMVIEGNVYSDIRKADSTLIFLEQLQHSGYRGRILVVDETQYAAGNGFISDDVILGGNY